MHFRALPRYLTDQWPGVEPNVLRIGLTEPYVRLSTTLNGPGQAVERRQLETSLGATSDDGVCALGGGRC